MRGAYLPLKGLVTVKTFPPYSSLCFYSATLLPFLIKSKIFIVGSLTFPRQTIIILRMIILIFLFQLKCIFIVSFFGLFLALYRNFRIRLWCWQVITWLVSSTCGNAFGIWHWVIFLQAVFITSKMAHLIPRLTFLWLKSLFSIWDSSIFSNFPINLIITWIILIYCSTSPSLPFFLLQ